MKRFKVLIAAVGGLIAIAVAIALAAYGRFGQQDSIGFFQAMGFDAEDVEAVVIQHHDTSVELRQAYCDRLIECLSKARGSKLSDAAAYPYTPTDYAISFIADGKEIPVIFSWFIGEEYKPLENGIITTKYLDSRFDICIHDQWYCFQQDEDAIWHEKDSVDAYKKSAQYRKIKLLPQYKIDGYDSEVSHIDGSDGIPMGITWQGRSRQEIIDASDLLVVATSAGMIHEDEYPYELEYRYCNFESFQVQEVLKGSCDDNLLYVYQEYGERSNGTQILYPPAEDPLYEKGKTYLLCLKKKEGEGYYQMTAGIFSSGIVQGDRVYPRYNTEYHPFANITLEEVTPIKSGYPIRKGS